jgi:aspartate 1-decarboxylase
MKRTVLESKIHRAQVDDAECRDFEGIRIFVDGKNVPRDLD